MPIISNATSRISIPRTSGSSRRNTAAAIALLLILPTALLAQGRITTAGVVQRVMRGDTVPVPGVMVTLHRVSSAGSGPIDSIRADARGRFRFSVRRDSAATYLLSARYAGVAYFSPAIGTDPRLDMAVALLVADTSSGAGAPVRLEARHIVIERPGADGSRHVTDLLVLDNRGPDTRVAPDTVRAAWGTRLPRGIVDAVAGDGDFSPNAVAFRNDSVLIFAPISLGEAQMVVQYTLPPDAGTVGFPVEDSIGSLNVLAEEGGARVSGAGLSAAEAEQLDGREFLHWSGGGVAGTVVTVRLGGGGAVPAWALPLLLGLMVAGLVLVTLRLRRPAVVPALAHAGASGRLIDQVAALDLRYAGREGETAAGEWSAYLAERTRLVRALEDALAAEGAAS